MNRSVVPLIAGSLLVLLGTGCSAGAPHEDLTGPTTGTLLQPGDSCSNYSGEDLGTFEDANLEAGVRASLGGRTHLTCDALAGVETLHSSDAGIMSLVGIQNLTALTHLGLEGNEIVEVGPLAALTTLTNLNLNHNSVTDISAVEGLVGLKSLALSDNYITDISPVSNLTSLEALSLAENDITTIPGLRGLTRLTTLRLDLNGLTDIRGLSGVTSLKSLFLYGNSITDISVLWELTMLNDFSLGSNPDLSDIQPLLANTGLGRGVTVDLSSTSVECRDVALLQAVGVRVYSAC